MDSQIDKKNTILISPVTRIEGHAKITIMLGADGAVKDARFHVNEFRGFEKFCEGRLFTEMPTITPRICGICPGSHSLASVKACEMMMGIKPTYTGNLLRRLIHLGQMISSHALSFFPFVFTGFYFRLGHLILLCATLWGWPKTFPIWPFGGYVCVNSARKSANASRVRKSM